MESRPTGRAALWFWAAALVLLATRVPHLRGPLTDPHSWRQCDTVHFALDFYRRGFDLMHPAVCWLGAYRTNALNFPLSEAITALLYRAFGPDPMWDRIVALSFFVLSACWLHGIAARLATRRLAALTTLAYLALPLGQYFSRVPHIEFPVLACVNGTLYYTLRASAERSARWMVAATACAAMAAAIKGPYLGTIGLPLLLIVVAAPTLANAARVAIPLVAAAISFEWWRHHVDSVNAGVPDWSFLPGFYKEVNPLWRYIGTLAQRADARSWIKISKRLIFEVATPPGVVLSMFALWRSPHGSAAAAASDAGGARHDKLPSAHAVAFGWFAGCVGLALVFFPLSVEHNYYQLPFLAPTALLIALGADALWSRLRPVAGVPAAGVLFAVFVVFALWAPRTLEYDRVDWLRIEAGKIIAPRIPAADLIVASDVTTLPPIDPRLLFRAEHDGWPMRAADITPERLARLRPYGAKWVVVVTGPTHPEVQPPAFLASAETATVPVLHDGRELGTVHIFDLSSWTQEAPAAEGGSTPANPAAAPAHAAGEKSK
jgi:Dolichyl-phosphate-mannose-protein mannosyltransferase